mgnify:FL=1
MNDILDFVDNNLFSIITAFIAIIALLQTHKQIKISNKQFLFDKRLSKYLLANGLLELYKDNATLLDYTDHLDEEPIIVDYQFINLTNNNYLKDITCIIKEPKNNDFKNNFLVKIEELKKLSNEIKFLFHDNSGVLLGNFIMEYQNVLMELYKYQIVLDSMVNDNIPRKNKPPYNELQKNYDELKRRYRLYDAIDDLKKSYHEVVSKKIVNEIEKSIKL